MNRKEALELLLRLGVSAEDAEVKLDDAKASGTSAKDRGLLVMFGKGKYEIYETF